MAVGIHKSRNGQNNNSSNCFCKQKLYNLEFDNHFDSLWYREKFDALPHSEMSSTVSSKTGKLLPLQLTTCAMHLPRNSSNASRLENERKILIESLIALRPLSEISNRFKITPEMRHHILEIRTA